MSWCLGGENILLEKSFENMMGFEQIGPNPDKPELKIEDSFENIQALWLIKFLDFQQGIFIHRKGAKNAKV